MSDFLQELFRDAPSTDFVPVVVAVGQRRYPNGDTVPELVDPEEWLKHTQWLPVKEVLSGSYQIDATNQDHVYFTPHTYTYPTDIVAADELATNIIQGTCVWLESYDDNFNWWLVSEAPPTAVVSTSPLRHQVYWFLTEPVPLEDIEQVNRALAHRYLTRDRSGTERGQLMRMPGYHNYKHLVDHSVELEHYTPHQRVEFYETFESLLLLDVPHESGARSKNFQLPGQGLRDSRDVRRQFEPYFTPQFMSYLKTRANDRAKALWYMYHECYQMGMSELDAYSLLLSCPNNRFDDAHYNRRIELWADVRSAYRMLRNAEPLAVQDEIRYIRTDKGSVTERNQRIADVVRKHMLSRGAFYYAPTTQRVVYHYNRRLIDVDQKDVEFRALADRQYTLNPTSQEFAYLAEHLRDRAVSDAQRVNLHNVAHYDQDNNILYVSDNRGGMFRLDGQQVEHLEMGVDGVMFNDSGLSEAVYLADRKPAGSPLYDYILSLSNFSPADSTLSNTLTPEQCAFLIRSWLYAIFFLFESKPILIIEGTHGSGKSTMFKALEWVLTGPQGNVVEMQADATLLREALRERHHVFLDGVESASAAQQNILSTSATGSQDTRRVLYSNNNIARYTLSPALGLTTMSAQYLRHDILDRAIVLNTQRFKSFRSIEDIKQDVMVNRSELWAELIGDLNAIIEYRKTYKPGPAVLRMASYETYLRILCAIKNEPLDPYLEYLRAVQIDKTLGNTAAYVCLTEFLQADPAHYDTEYTAPQLHKHLVAHAGFKGYDYTKQIATSRALAVELRKMEGIVDYTKSVHRGSDVYTFARPKAEDVSV